MVRFEIMGDAVLVPGESWAMIAQPGIAGTEGVDPILNLSLNHIAGDFAGAAILRKLFGQVFDVKLKHAAARHLRAGQAAGDLADGDRRRREEWMPALREPEPFQLEQPLDDLDALFDRVYAAPLQTGVGRAALYVDLQEQDAPAGRLDVQSRGLRDDGCVGLVTFHDAAQRSVAAAFFVYNALYHDVAGRWIAGLTQKARSQNHGCDTRLHVAYAEPVHDAVLDFAAPRVMAPLAAVARRHRVHVAVEDQRAPTACSPERPNQIGPFGVTMPRAKIWEGLHLVVVRLEEMGLKTPLSQGHVQPLLDGIFLAVESMLNRRTVKLHHLAQKIDRVLAPGINQVADLSTGVHVIHSGREPTCRPVTSRQVGLLAIMGWP